MKCVYVHADYIGNMRIWYQDTTAHLIERMLWRSFGDRWCEIDYYAHIKYKDIFIL